MHIETPAAPAPVAEQPRVATLADPTALTGPCTNCGQKSYRISTDGPVSHSDSGEAECDEREFAVLRDLLDLS